MYVYMHILIYGPGSEAGLPIAYRVSTVGVGRYAVPYGTQYRTVGRYAIPFIENY